MVRLLNPLDSIKTMAPKTTTWKSRNQSLILRTRYKALRKSLLNPTIIDYGPGGLIRFLAPLVPTMNQGNPKNLNFPRKIQRGIVKASDAVLRRARCFDLETFEPVEIFESFEALHPKKIYVVDNSKAVGDAVEKARDAKFNNTLNILEFIKTDISEKRLPYTGDIVFAFNIAERTRNPESALRNIADSVKSGGLLATTYDVPLSEYTEFNDCGPNLYEKRVN